MGWRHLISPLLDGVWWQHTPSGTRRSVGDTKWMASCTSGLTHIKKTRKIHDIDSNNLINIRVSHPGLDQGLFILSLVRPFRHWCCYLFVVICIYSFYPVLHVAANRQNVGAWCHPYIRFCNADVLPFVSMFWQFIVEKGGSDILILVCLGHSVKKTSSSVLFLHHICSLQ